MALSLNLFIPFLSPYLILTVVISSTCLSLICIIFKIRLNLGLRRRHEIVNDDDDDKSEMITLERPEISDPIPLDRRSIVQFQQQQQQQQQNTLPFAITHEQIPFIRSNHHRHIHYDNEGRTTF